jgi:hypothetical protein
MAEGRKVAAARGEGRALVTTTELPNEVPETTFRPTRCRNLLSGGTPIGKPAAFRGRASAHAHILQYMRKWHEPFGGWRRFQQ